MYAYQKEHLAEYPRLLDAITLCELMGLSWRSLYMDPDNELAINFNGKLTEKQVKNVLMHFMDILHGDTDLSIIQPKLHQDYEICDWKGDVYTQIWTPDGYDYKNMVIHKNHTNLDEPRESMFAAAFEANEINDFEF